MAKPETFYITTPIYYVNAKPHLGTLYSTVLADVAARWQRLRGKHVHFLTGTDEHGQKVADSAHKAGMAPQQFVDQLIPSFTSLWQQYAISYDQFIRTTDIHHIQTVQAWITELMGTGDIYLGAYEGWYCTGCETFVTSSDAQPPCPTCGRTTQQISEPAYFFKLSKYQEQLLILYREHPNFVAPAERLAEVISFVEGGLKDLCISRTTLTWGIPFPGDPKHVTYVWADALNNYLSAIGYKHPNERASFDTWWPANCHVMGKDIVRFHAVYWPAFLMAAGLTIPHTLLVHGWIKVGDQKMSKSLGNAIDPVALHATYGADQIRYYITRYLAISHDSSFTIPEVEQHLNADLAHALGNLLNRIVMLADRYGYRTLPAPEQLDSAGAHLRQTVIDAIATCNTELEQYYFHRAYNSIWGAIHAINAYMHTEEPWKLFKTAPADAAHVLSIACHALHAVAVATLPVMPTKMAELLATLGITVNPTVGVDHIQELIERSWQQSYILTPGPLLFTQYDTPKEIPVENQKTAPITIDTLASVELLVGTITHVESIEKSNKMYKMTVDLGAAGTRTILAGIRAYFTPEELRGKQGTFVANLAPRPMLGLVSEGMMLVVDDGNGKRALVSPSTPVPNGMRLG